MRREELSPPLLYSTLLSLAPARNARKPTPKQNPVKRRGMRSPVRQPRSPIPIFRAIYPLATNNGAYARRIVRATPCHGSGAGVRRSPLVLCCTSLLLWDGGREEEEEKVGSAVCRVRCSARVRWWASACAGVGVCDVRCGPLGAIAHHATPHCWERARENAKATRECRLELHYRSNERSVAGRGDRQAQEPLVLHPSIHPVCIPQSNPFAANDTQERKQK
ncbi:hypothetical protein P171DRAFT_178150 [Karstenula rhodostoma CBS 690.94]|uniref:Uncharacterized protein n=1 Tax=Karstenula rhodostoma CBS 690.94 TaxID=1392251 RepID=A0A9P4P546_9PLEO|nr:hypothetical protein P171DRAFT_178150 [Karstenula rhodostoma CBS 690.94]